MPTLKVQDTAKAKGFTISQLQRKADISMPTARRYWYGTADGKEHGKEALSEINLEVLKKIADALGVTANDLISIEN